MEQQLPPGFRFYPTEEELITFYLNHKLHSQRPEIDRVIPSIDIYNFEPCEIPGFAGELCHGDTEQWFFFVPRQEREARGGRPNRTTASGYWKATGSPNYVYSSHNKAIGMKKTMVFYKGKAPIGKKTKWKMNEYKAIKQELIANNNTYCPSSSTAIPELQHELSLCRVYVTSGCARAFDRRPQGGPIILPNTTNVPNNGSNFYQGEGSGAASENVHAAATLLLEKSGSTDSSNSGGNDQQGVNLQDQEAAVAGSGNSTFDDEMTDDLATFFNWYQQNWP